MKRDRGKVGGLPGPLKMAGLLRHRTNWSLNITCLFIVANGGIWLTINGSYKDMALFEQDNSFRGKL